ncbi:DUF6778 family protein [Pseudooceanicola sp. HF7]|uniref:DUF6778 family protein n=1 Tax=Pseudooceanicola sp. HF7 TaxID=2721560 RepID=UPI001431D18E|nr:DUF6778 family protein [Pseudooceanicola sp. HF7]NIZ08772.1 hypothetical protein [Pseudooceanicola sp. HF7]
MFKKAILSGAVLGSVALLSACGVSKEAFYVQSVDLAKCTPLSEKGVTDYDVKSYAVRVPRSLKTNETDNRHPDVDIVWREDPEGDRHAQVQTIVTDAARRAFKASNGGQDANVGIEVAYFHAMSDKTRATTGGWLTVTLYVTITDPVTQELLEPTYELKTQLNGYGGAEAIAAVDRGETQKYRISRNLTEALQVDVLGICPTEYPAPVARTKAPVPTGELPDAVERL